jgi:hypothetical protein
VFGKNEVLPVNVRFQTKALPEIDTKGIITLWNIPSHGRETGRLSELNMGTGRVLWDVLFP